MVKFLFNEEKEVIAEETDGEVIRYIHGLGIISSDSESARTYYHYVSDNQGSVRLILTDTTNDRRICNYYCYDAFGESIISHENVHNRFRFNGEQYDSVTSQYYLRARFYNPVIGRFTQEDTCYGDGLNLYEYCRNNPVLYRDPSGHDAVNQGNLYGNENKTKYIYRAVGVDEYEDIMLNGKFRGIEGKTLAAKEFGNDFYEMLEFANKTINKDKVAIIKVTIPQNVYGQLNHMNLDISIFKSGTPVVEPDMLDFFNDSIISIEHYY